MLQNKLIRWLGWLVIGCTAAVIGLHVVNAIRLDATGLNDSAQDLIDRAVSISDRAIPEYQDLVLATLPDNPNNGPFYRFDDNLPEAKTVSDRSNTQLDEGGGFELKLEFEGGQETGMVAIDGRTTYEKRDGSLIVRHRDGDFLINDKPLQIPLANISEIIFRARADRGNRFTIQWAAEGRESTLEKNRLSLDLIADGEFHTYVIDAQNALQRGVRFGENLSQLAIAPSNVDGAVVEIDFVGVVSKRWKYQTEGVGTSYESIAGELRPVLYMVRGHQVEYVVDIPEESPVLSFGAASLQRGSPIGVSITVDADGESKELFSAENLGADRWQDEIVDLASWAGRTVHVTFEVRGAVENVALLSNPMIRSAAQRRFNVIMILEDTLRADHLSTHGYERETSPARTRIMNERGIVFLNAHSQSTKTRPSIPALMTALYPTATGVLGFSDFLSDRYLTLAEIFRAQGFVTASFIQNGNAGPYAGLHQGFSSIRTSASLGNATEDVLGGRTLDWLDQNGDRNFFLYLHAIDPHGQYDPPPPYDSWYREAAPESLVGAKPLAYQTLDPDWAETPSAHARRLLYDGEIRHNDERIDSFIEELDRRNLLEDTLLVFVSDHGEWLGERGYWEHHPPGNRPVIHVPLMLSYPKVFDTPRRIEESVQLVDAMPTILELASVDGSDLLMHGDSLVSLIQGTDQERWRKRITVSEEPMAMLRENPCACGSLFFGPWQLHGSRKGWPGRIQSTFVKSTVYRFREDGVTPVASYLPDLYSRYLRQKILSKLITVNMQTWRKLTEGQQLDVYKMDPGTLEELRGLGYVN